MYDLNKESDNDVSDMTNDEKEGESPEDREIKDLIINCVKTGNTRFLDLLLDEPGSDLDLVYFGENLLMLSIRLGHEDTAKFLLENGADVNFEKKVFYRTIKDSQQFLDFFTIDCRQMAYRKEMYDLVESIDYLNNNYNKFRIIPQIQVRDRSEKRGMFYDVISLHEEFFSPKKSPLRVKDTEPRNDGDKTVSIKLSKSCQRPKSSLFQNCHGPKETKSLFLRKRISSATQKLTPADSLQSPGISYTGLRVKSALHYR